MKLVYIIPSFQKANLDVHKVPESKTMMDLANGVALALKNAPFKVMVSRQPNITLAMREANRLKVDLVLHLHSDAGGGKGCTAFYDPLKPRTKVFANNLTRAVSTALGVFNRGAKDGRLAKLLAIRGTAMGIDSVLLESFFHDNKQDVAKAKEYWARLCNEIGWQIKVCLGVK